MKVRRSPAPLDGRRPSGKDEVLFKALRAVISLEVDMAKGEILAKLEQLEVSIETLARALAVEFNRGNMEGDM